MKRTATVCLVAILALAVSLPAFAKKDRAWADDDGKIVIVDGDKQIRLFGDREGAYLGVTLAELDEETAEAAGLEDSEGALVRSVFEDTPAEEAGLRAGDVIVEFDGEDVTDVAALMELVSGHEPGDEVKLEARRDGKGKTMRVTLGERERGFTLFGGDGDRGDWTAATPWALRMGQRGRLGVEVRDLEGDLAGYFPGAENGALVLGVEEDSAAEKAGLKSGDVIVSLGDETVTDVEDLLAAVSQVEGEGEAELVYYRRGKRESSQVEIEEGHMAMGLEHLHRGLDRGDHSLRGIFRGFDDRNWEQKLEKMERRLEELEQRLDRKPNQG